MRAPHRLRVQSGFLDLPGRRCSHTIHLFLPQTIHGHLGATTGQLIVEVAGASLSATGAEGHTQSGCSTSLTLEAFKQP